MKKITSLKILVFTTAFFIGIGLVNLTINNSFYRNLRGIDTQSQAKIYNFLLKDKQLLDEYFNKSVAAQVADRKGIWVEYVELRVSQDTSDLPKDFQDAWQKHVFSEYYLIQSTFGSGTLKIIAQKEKSKEKPEEWRTFAEDFKSVTENYGVELNSTSYRLK